MPKQKKDIPDYISHQLKVIGKRLHRLRLNAEEPINLEEINITRMTVWRIEQGKDSSLSTILQLLDAYDIKPEEFFKDLDSGENV